mgnify:CR=1 FL=1
MEALCFLSQPDKIAIFFGCQVVIMAVEASDPKSVDVVSTPGPEDIHTLSKESLSDNSSDDSNGKTPPPLAAKLCAVALISCISFGSHWSSGVTGAMKSTMKKVLNAMETSIRSIH